MTLCILDIEQDCKQALNVALKYLYVTIFSSFFGLIYGYFSHGVTSNYMVYFFLFPLVGGVLPFLWMGTRAPKWSIESWGVRLYHWGVAALTVGSCVTGVLEIYGTTAALTKVYWSAGILLMGLGAGLYWREQFLDKDRGYVEDAVPLDHIQ